MLSTTQNNNGTNIKTSYSPFLLGNEVQGNSTGVDNSSSTKNNDGHTTVMTIAQKASDIFSEPIESITISVCLLGIIANGASIIAVVKMRKKMTTHLKLIISLCMSDALILLAYLSLYAAYIFTNWHYCTKAVVRLTGDIAILATLLNLFVMALDHYGAIIKPLLYKQKMTNIKGNCAVLIVWFISILGGLTEVFTAIGQGGSICFAIIDGNFYIEMFIIGFIFFVLTAICFLYGRIYCRIKEAMPLRERASHHSEAGSLKALMTTALFVGTFILLWTPFALFSIYMYTDNVNTIQDIDAIFLINNILFLFLLLNACFDPIIYAVRLPTVKRGLLSLFTSSVRSSTLRADKNSTHLQPLCAEKPSTHAQPLCVGKTSTHQF